MSHDGDWWCPECVANHPGPGTCIRCDITLVHGHPDKEQQ
jgi:hypothetical protein